MAKARDEPAIHHRKKIVPGAFTAPLILERHLIGS
jgi:hypothetical protein